MSIKAPKFMTQVYIWITAAMIIFTILFSFVVYFNIEKIVLMNEQEHNQRLLAQVKINIENLNKTIRATCKDLYANSDTSFLMSTELGDSDYGEIFVKMKNLTSMFSSETYIHSIYIYNGKMSTYFSSYKSLQYHDDELLQFLSTRDTIPRLKPMLRWSENEGDTLFTYFIYDDYNREEGFLGGAVVVNISKKWVLNQIQTISQMDGNDAEAIYMIDSQGVITGDFEGEIHLQTQKVVSEMYDTQDNSQYNGFVEKTINGENVLLSHVTIEEAGLTIVKQQGYNKIYKYIDSLRTRIIFVTILFFFVNILLSLYVSGKIYKPVGNLLNHFMTKHDKNEKLKMKDEFLYIRNTYMDSNDKLNQSERKYSAYKHVIKASFLRKLLEDSASVTDDEFEKMKFENGLMLDYHANFVVCIAKIDNFHELEVKSSSKDLELNRFCIANITNEIVSKHFKNEAFDLGNDVVAIIVQTDFNLGNTTEQLEEAFQESQENIATHLDLSVTYAMSSIIAPIRNITNMFLRTMNNVQYRFVYGKKTILSDKIVKGDENHIDMKYFKVFDRKLSEVFKNGTRAGIDELLLEASKELQKMNYNSISIFLMNTIHAIKSNIDDLNKSRLNPLYFDVQSLKKEYLEIETMDELLNRTREVLNVFITEKRNTSNHDKYQILAKSVIDYIGANYHKSELCIDQIADVLHASTKHLNRVFRDHHGMSIQKYLNDLRLRKAEEWMEKSDLNISDIIQKIGFSNEAYFYTLFKKEHGTTPREYILRKKVSDT